MALIQRSITPVILCGGGGTRLWPLSRLASPKPFLPLIGDETLFERALARLSGDGFTDPIVVTGSAQAEVVRRQSAGHPILEVIVEPEPKGTAVAVGLAASRVATDEILLVCPSDHHFDDEESFLQAAQAGATLAAEGWITCLGVPARTAETRFGYIRRGDPLAGGCYRVAQFAEKPDLHAAKAFVASGDFAWNSGIFAFRAGDYLEELGRFRPAMAAAVDRASRGNYLDYASLSTIEQEALDTAIMENTDRAAVVMMDPGWSDVGDWKALHEKRPKDADGNSVRGPAELLDCRSVLVDSDGPRVHVLGLDEVIVVVQGGDVLVARAERAGQVARLSGARKRDVD